VSPSGGGLDAETPPGVNWGQCSLLFFLSHLFTFMLLHPLHEAGESICVVFEACIHASEAAKTSHDHVGLIEFLFKTE
jgi:hypothetical protein